jgi:hypothetical protein
MLCTHARTTHAKAPLTAYVVYTCTASCLTHIRTDVIKASSKDSNGRPHWHHDTRSFCPYLTCPALLPVSSLRTAIDQSGASSSSVVTTRAEKISSVTRGPTGHAATPPSCLRPQRGGALLQLRCRLHRRVNRVCLGLSRAGHANYTGGVGLLRRSGRHRRRRRRLTQWRQRRRRRRAHQRHQHLKPLATMTTTMTRW